MRSPCLTDRGENLVERPSVKAGFNELTCVCSRGDTAMGSGFKEFFFRFRR